MPQQQRGLQRIIFQVFPDVQGVAVWAKARIIFDFSAIPDLKIGAIELNLLKKCSIAPTFGAATTAW
jgi:hypothetical protein